MERTPIISAVIDMARKLNLFTVAEGVETAEQAQLLREQGCDYAQGYHFSKPVAADLCRALLEKSALEKPLTGTATITSKRHRCTSGLRRSPIAPLQPGCAGSAAAGAARSQLIFFCAFSPRRR